MSVEIIDCEQNSPEWFAGRYTHLAIETFGGKFWCCSCDCGCDASGDNTADAWIGALARRKP